ncbi:MAG: hypothetical protein CMA63_05500 [Euryarchaeota archaeon]|nr:hypothetical protein [Euryarchaeota archaeon]
MRNGVVFKRGEVLENTMEFATQSKGSGIISLMTAGLGLYFTAAMWAEFNDALGNLLGPSLGIVVGTVVFMLYQSKKNEKEFTDGGNYLTAEGTAIVRDSEGRLQQVEGMIEKGRNPAFFVGMLYFFIIVLSEISWSDLLL